MAHNTELNRSITEAIVNSIERDVVFIRFVGLKTWRFAPSIMMSGDFLVRSSQLVNGEMITAIAVPTGTNKTIIAESCFMFIGRGCSIFRSRPDCWVRRCSATSVSQWCLGFATQNESCACPEADSAESAVAALAFCRAIPVPPSNSFQDSPECHDIHAPEE